MQTLNIIGAGRVGQTLGRLWHSQGVFALQDVLTQSPASAQAACHFMGAGTPVTQAAHMRAADVWMLAVPDAHIAATAQALAAQAEQLPPATVFHCSGAQSAALLAPLAAKGWQTASAHCILSFASAQAALQQFSGTPCALEGDTLATALLHQAFTAIEARCFAVKSQDKLLYHAAAVFATNFLPVLQNVAEEAWTASGVPTDLLPGLRAALLNNAVANITRLGPQGALTGPAARGDVAAIAQQAAAVTQWDAQAGAAYEALSALALRMAKASTDSSATPASSR
ncbi:DUF2520 domain-containing protein [Rhodoferax lacus]|uniref:DUF2520 domain-containing protein n=1 Tax=Rhodoferax lacus TaxID=2184758 RepID=A0A3E1RCH1_9BURK|nr:Rossmann-like and DUF2520 domain-containing protein [Rhodoferax lacus]RFO96330.1 DUF2520 domain-containing protein [Rhodoferax lacus]